MTQGGIEHSRFTPGGHEVQQVIGGSLPAQGGDRHIGGSSNAEKLRKRPTPVLPRQSVDSRPGRMTAPDSEKTLLHELFSGEVDVEARQDTATQKLIVSKISHEEQSAPQKEDSVLSKIRGLFSRTSSSKSPHETVIDVVSTSDSFYAGGRAEKHRIIGQMGSHIVSLIERKNLQNFAANWRTYKDAGLPVVPTMRETQNGTVVMTDLKVDGSELYGQNLMVELVFASKSTEARRAPAPGVDEHFMKLTDPEHIEELAARVDAVVDTANKNGVLLPEDPMVLRVSPDGSSRLYVLDCENMQEVAVGASAHLGNSQANERFFKRIMRIRKELEKTAA